MGKQGAISMTEQESMAQNMELLEARMSDMMADLTALKEQFQSQFEHKLLPATPRAAAVGIQANRQPQTPPQQQCQQRQEEEEEVRSEPSQFLEEDVTLLEVHERLQRLEVLLFRLPVPDFLQLDRAMAQLMQDGGDAPAMPESVLEEEQMELMELSSGAKKVVGEAEEAAVEVKQANIPDLISLEELGIFNDYDAYKGARSVTSAADSDGTSDDDGSRIAGLEVFKKEDVAEDSDPEKPKITRSAESQGTGNGSWAASRLRIKVVATTNKPRGSDGEVMPSSSELLTRW